MTYFVVNFKWTFQELQCLAFLVWLHITAMEFASWPEQEWMKWERKEKKVGHQKGRVRIFFMSVN